MTTEQLSYPIGKFKTPVSVSSTDLLSYMDTLETFPQRLTKEVIDLTDAQLDTPYRPDGWTVRQVVHHVADSHMNAYCRFKLGLTEDNPSIKPYDEKLWAEMNDVHKLPINISLTLLHALHTRWYEAIKHVSDNDWNNRTVFHPEQKKTMRLWFLLGMYAWHGNHHVAHINLLRKEKGW